MKAALRPVASESDPYRQSMDAGRNELARCRAMARSWMSEVPELGRRDLAALFARSAMLALARMKSPNYELSSPLVQPFGRLDTAGARLARATGEMAANLGVIEGTHFVSSLYTTLLATSERAVLGAFHTPPALSNRLVALADEAGTDWRTAKVLDPASGGCGLLLPVIARMIVALDEDPAALLDHISGHVLGFEIDPHAAWLGQAGVELLLADAAAAAQRSVPSVVKVCDTLDEPAEARFDLVIGNPPYGRVALTDRQRMRFGRSLYGHANLCGVFMDIAVRWAKPTGVIAYLTPASILGGQYFGALRETMLREAPPQAIDFVCSRRGVFEDALQETVLALYRRGAERRSVQVHYLKVTNEREARLQRNGTVALPAAPRAPWIAPRLPTQSKLVAAAASKASRLADWGYSVSTGPLVWNRHKNQLRAKPGRDCYPLVWAEAVTADGRFVLRAERRNHLPYFHVRAGDAWLLVREPAVLLQRTTAKEQARRLVAAELPLSLIEEHGAVVVENHLNMVRAGPAPRVSTTALAAVLNSTVIDQLFRCISGSVAVSAFELEALPLPEAKQMREIESLVAGGATPQEIDRKLAALYGAPWPL